MSVIDASAVVDLLLKSDTSASTKSIFSHDVYAPALLIPETMSALKKATLLKHLTKESARDKVALLAFLPVELIPMQRLSLDVWELSDTFSSYDACYVSLARQLEQELITSDKRLANEARRFVRVKLLH